MEIAICQERITVEEYIEFLTRTDLGGQYPKERFAERIETLVSHAPVSLTARHGDKLVGVLFGITDFAYWLFVTDLGVDRAYEKRGIGTNLMKEALSAAGGERDINVYLCANHDAIPFYEKLGMKRSDDVYEYCKADWTSFTVTKDLVTKGDF